jgi:hypothetical protein
MSRRIWVVGGVVLGIIGAVILLRVTGIGGAANGPLFGSGQLLGVGPAANPASSAGVVPVKASDANLGSAAATQTGVNRKLNFKNTTSHSVTVGHPTVTGSAFSIVQDDCGGKDLPSGAVCGVTVHYTPSGKGEDKGALKVPPMDPLPIVGHSFIADFAGNWVVTPDDPRLASYDIFREWQVSADPACTKEPCRYTFSSSGYSGTFSPASLDEFVWTATDNSGCKITVAMQIVAREGQGDQTRARTVKVTVDLSPYSDCSSVRISGTAQRES